MSITLEDAKQSSKQKWIDIQNKFNEVFGVINTKCGFCDLALMVEANNGAVHKCDVCIPKIKDVCFEMQIFFSSKQGEIENMITRIHLYIKNATIEKKGGESE